MTEHEDMPREDGQSESDETIEDLEVPKGQAGDVSGGAGGSGGSDLLTESISLNTKK